MDQGSNPALGIDANSVGSSFANLELNHSPINRLPNKLLQRILSKVERMVPIQKFVSLRSVDTRWQSVVDNVFKDKKSLIVIIREKYSSRTVQVEDLFFGLLDETDFIRVNIQSLRVADGDGDTYIVVDGNIFESLLKALPNIEQLYICCSDTNGIDYHLAAYTNSLFSLKKLYLGGDFYCLFNFLERLQNNLSRLEFFYFKVKNYFVRSVAINFDYVRQLHARNPRWLANGNQLSFTVGLNDQFDHIVHFLHEHATGLNALYLKFGGNTQITSALFGHICKLTQLKQVALGPVQFEVLKQAANAIELNQFTPLTIITTCNLVISNYHSVTVDQFTRVLLTIFPNVVNWKYCTRPNVRELKIMDKTLDEFFQSLNNNLSQ